MFGKSNSELIESRLVPLMMLSEATYGKGKIPKEGLSHVKRVLRAPVEQMPSAGYRTVDV
jgi:hypothetical protein